jgi:hypothetical protein
MKNLLILFSVIGLLSTIAPPFLMFLGKIELGEMKTWMGVGMLLWFVSAPFWINKSVDSDQSK